MRNVTIASILLLSSLSSLAGGSPVASKPKPNKPKPTCTPVTLNFDELGNSAGSSRGLPGGGYNYKGFNIVENQWGWVSKGDQANGDFTEDDRPVSEDGYQHTIVFAHSGTNALMNVADTNVFSIDAAGTGKGRYYYDLKSFWVRPEYKGAFNLRLSCGSYYDEYNSNTTFRIPELGAGKYYQVKLPANKYRYLHRCHIGAVQLEQVLLDDIKVCQWYWNYKKSVYPPFVKT